MHGEVERGLFSEGVGGMATAIVCMLALEQLCTLPVVMTLLVCLGQLTYKRRPCSAKNFTKYRLSYLSTDVQRVSGCYVAGVAAALVSVLSAPSPPCFCCLMTDGVNGIANPPGSCRYFHSRLRQPLTGRTVSSLTPEHTQVQGTMTAAAAAGMSSRRMRGEVWCVYVWECGEWRISR